jgi:murein DD-endopeptidase MepM/ murein hydrolase activator NlpD
MIEQKKNRDLLPVLGAVLCSTTFLFGIPSAQANTLGTLSIPSSSVSSGNEADVNAAILNSSTSRDVVASRTVTLGRSDTLDGLLVREGVSKDQREAAIRALGDFVDAASLKPGIKIEFSIRGSEPSHRQLVALHIRTDANRDLTIVAGSDGRFHPLGKTPAAAAAAKDWSVGVVTRNGTIAHGLKADLVAARVPEGVADDVVSAFGYDPDIPAKPSKGSRFTVVYETAGAARDASNVLRYASISVYGQEHRIYRYETNGGEVAFMEENGRGYMPLQLGSPVHNARMTSPWGWRIHPVLKVRKFHKGVDFAAPRGTPVYAAEDGVIEDQGWRGNYGRYVRIRHNDRVETAYAHLAKFAAGLHPGSHVRKGQVIAYVGASGLATGNHLYYEVLVDKNQVDPAGNVMVQVNLDGNSLARFQTYVAQLSQNATQP